MADGDAALQAGKNVGFGEIVADETHAAFGVKVMAVVGADACRFLAAVLEGMEP